MDLRFGKIFLFFVLKHDSAKETVGLIVDKEY